MIFREADITYSDELDTTGRKMIIAPLVARGIIQKYIDNLLNPSYWFQLWLNEGFIIFLQAYIVDKVVLFLRHEYTVKTINSLQYRKHLNIYINLLFLYI